MKKLGKSLVLLFLAIALLGCTAKQEKNLFLITDIGTIDDKSFNQGSWEGMKKYADEVKSKPTYLQPAEKTTQAYYAEIVNAAEAGAKVIVTPGYLFEEAVHQAQEAYPDIKFVLVDGNPHAGDYVADYRDNTVGILYQEEQAGFLAGYAAVKDGHTKLGFMGGVAVPAVVRFGYGYVAGADYAAKELGINIEMRYTYLESFLAQPEWEAQASAWYNDGIEVIFAAAGGAGNSVMAAASKAQDKWVIGVDVDQKDESPTVLTSAFKNLQDSVYDAVKAAMEGTFPGGKAQLLTINEDMVGIPNDFSRFTSFNEDDYKAIVDKLKADENGVRTSIPNTDTTDDAAKLPVTNTTITVIK